MKKIIFLLLLVNVFSGIKAQTLKDAETLFNDKKYDEAIAVYEKLLEKQPRDYVLKCKVGHCLVDMERYEEAIPLLEQAAKKVKRAYLYLYDAYFYTYEFDKSINALNEFLESSEGKFMDESQSASRLSRSELGTNMLARVEDVAILDSVKILKADLLSAYKLSDEMGMLEMENDTMVDPFIQKMVYYTGRRDKRISSKPTDASGQLDLRVAYDLVGEWTAETDLSNVLNTKEDENYPFELPDGVTLYFASKGHNSLGGYDIFMTRYNANTDDYSDPVNIGMPFNSPSNDYLMVFDEMTHIGWFATDRNQHEDSAVVYEFIPNQEKILIKTEDENYRRSAAQLKTYRKGELKTVRNAVLGNSPEEKETQINFMVNDGIVYTKIDQFVSKNAVTWFLKMEATEQRLITLERLLEGKRTEFYFSTIEKDKENLRIEILKLESDINRYKKLVKEYKLQTRREELKVINK